MNTKFVIRLLGPAIFGIILFFFIDLKELQKILSLSRYDFLVLSLATVPVIIAVRSIRWQKILAIHTIDYTFWTCFKYNVVELVAIGVVSAAGSIIKVFYLRRDGYRLLDAAQSVVTDKAFDYLLPLIFGISSGLVFLLGIDPDRGLAVMLMVTLVIYRPLRSISVRLFPRIIPGALKAKMLTRNWRFEESFQQIILSLDFRAYLLSIFGMLVYFLAVHLLNLGLGTALSFAQVILIMALTSLITAIPISFLGIGTRDVALISVFTWFGRSPEEAVSLSIALLGLRLAIMAMGSLFWYMDPPPLAALKRGYNGPEKD